MTIFLYVIVGIVALVLILAIIAPKTYHVHRGIEIHKPLPEVFQYLKYIKNQDAWSPWDKKDPNQKKEHIGTDGQVGFIAKWVGNKDVGEGEQQVTRIVENDIVESKLRFFKPWKSESDAYIKVTKIDDHQTKVTWGFTGNNKFPSSIFMLFFSMDKMIGKDFESGLEDLKRILESK